MYGVPFKIISDHKALSTILKGQKRNKTYSSRLTRWVDRLLPFDFEVIHGPGRTLGLADYLSRNPTIHNESSINANTLWDEWFTVNIVSEMKTNLLMNRNAIRGERQPIRIENSAAEQKGEQSNSDAANGLKQTIKDALNENNYATAVEMTEREREEQQLQAIARKPPIKRPITLALIDKNSNTPLKSSIQRIGETILAGTYKSDQTLQKVITLIQHYDEKQFKKFPKVWQNRFNELSLDENNFLYLDERLVIPEELRRPIFRSLHWGHPGRDSMLQAVADIWWPQIHREIVLLAQTCNQCKDSGKNLKTIKPQSNFWKINRRGCFQRRISCRL